MKILLASIYPYAFMLLYLTIPFDDYIRAFPNLLLGILLIAFPIIVTKEDFKKLLLKPVLLFLLFFAFLLISAFLFGRFEDDFVVVRKMLIPLGLVILYLPVQDFKKLNKAIIFSSIAAIIFSVIKFVVLVNKTGTFNLNFFQDSIDVLLIDRLYIGFLCVLSILVSYQSLKKEYHPNNRYYLASILLNGLFILLIMSKVSMAIIFAIVLLRQFYGKQKKIRLLISLVVILLISGITYKSYKPYFEKVINSEHSISELNYNDGTIPWGYRSLVWKSSISIIKEIENKWNGIGFKETNNRLKASYENDINDAATKEIFLSKKFNTHNQFLDFYISSGIIGFLLFICVLGVLFFHYRKHFFATALLMSIILLGLVENFFHRQIGAYYFGFILVILLMNNTFFKESEKDKIT
ncbi:MAG: O-antigen ligase family protein [Flavobacteriaceae bacterium]|nr:O-antigen ligase family protein [Flavobacteriaceae bacterium]